MIARSGATWLRLLALAAAYYVTGRLGLLLAIPPGYATAIWAPSGVAFAGLLLFGWRLWPGVLLGSFAVNVGTAFDASSSAAIFRSLGLAGVIGGGAALQAVLGAWLVRRFANPTLELLREHDVATFLVLSGPISCLVSATVGVGALLGFGRIGAGQCPFSWWTWWVGDAIGVAVVAPVMLIAFAEPRAIWRRRWNGVAIPLAMVLGLIVTLFLWVSSLERARIRDEFQAQASRQAEGVRRKLDDTIIALHSLGALYLAVPEVDRVLFCTFSSHVLTLHPGIQGLSWNPRVAGADRSTFERAATDAGYAGFRILEQDESGSLRPAGDRDEYVVVLHIEPAPANAAARGFDVWSDATRREALRRAMEEARPMVTGRLSLIQSGRSGVLVFLPVYSMPAAPDSVDGRRSSLRGFVTAVLRLEDLVSSALLSSGSPEIKLQITDEGATPADRVLWPMPVDQASSTYQFHLVTPVSIAGRPWSLTSHATPAYEAAARSWRPWTMLAGALLLAALMVAFLLVVTGKAIIIERIGSDRAAELSSANAEMQREINDRKVAEVALSRKEGELRQAQKMDAIGRLAGGVAHDFNNLLTVILGYVDILQGRVGQNAAARGELEEIKKAGQRAADLTRQLLAFSRKQVLQPKVVELNRVVAALGNMLHRLIPEHIQIVTRLDPALGRIKADPGQVEQIILNLALNARDAMPTGGRLVIETANLTSNDGRALVELTVADTGVGMGPEVQAHLFEPFFTTKSPGHGTGLGLSTVYGIVQQSNAQIDVASEPGKGSSFRIRFFREEQALAPADVGTPAVPDRPARTATVLLVEDEQAVRGLARSVLEASGCSVIDAASGDEALRLAAMHRGVIDVLVTDLIMPRLGGRELAERLLTTHPSIKVLFMSGYSEEAVQSHGLEGRNASFLAKPFTPEQLWASAQTLLQGPSGKDGMGSPAAGGDWPKVPEPMRPWPHAPG